MVNPMEPDLNGGREGPTNGRSVHGECIILFGCVTWWQQSVRSAGGSFFIGIPPRRTLSDVEYFGTYGLFLRQADLAPKEMASSDMRNRRHVQPLLTWSTNAAHPVSLD
ncbi:hypothetical protein LAZ67_20000904 [Cordylochernes scorpioides]|uniref:Uncharacterized protein n=1 Tax=Cordylochernes scorpioides TaxID=51811 RepID=A0ABY6LKH5_9ARAC|nr:hypothetical protein LAZ67_20000904 [Cordylochernes scorpioides]